MDDLITPSATLESLQRKADIIAEFCVIFGVDIAIQKHRSYVANWSSTSIPANPTLLVCRGDWIPHPVQLQISAREAALALKYLRIHNILNNTSTTQLDILIRDTQRVAIRIQLRRASATEPQLTSSLNDMKKKLDKPIQKLLRKLSNNMTSFPTKLLYTSKKMAGLGFKRPTGIITTANLEIIHRAQLQSTDAANIAAGM